MRRYLCGLLLLVLALLGIGGALVSLHSSVVQAHSVAGVVPRGTPCPTLCALGQRRLPAPRPPLAPRRRPTHAAPCPVPRQPPIRAPLSLALPPALPPSPALRRRLTPAQLSCAPRPRPVRR